MWLHYHKRIINDSITTKPGMACLNKKKSFNVLIKHHITINNQIIYSLFFYVSGLNLMNAYIYKLLLQSALGVFKVFLIFST